jgi:glutamate-1-semialdehyde aminotransferase
VVAEATLPILTAGGAIDTMRAHGSELLEGLNRVFAAHGIEALAFGPSAMFDVIFRDDSLGREFYRRLLADGVLLEYGGTHLVSAATTGADIQMVLASADRVAGELLGGQPAPAGRGGRVPFETLAQNATVAINADPAELANWH